jgi:hypothetical protein
MLEFTAKLISNHLAFAGRHMSKAEELGKQAEHQSPQMNVPILMNEHSFSQCSICSLSLLSCTCIYSSEARQITIQQDANPHI